MITVFSIVFLLVSFLDSVSATPQASTNENNNPIYSPEDVLPPAGQIEICIDPVSGASFPSSPKCRCLKEDECGVCGGPGRGKCGCDESEGCDGVCGSEKVYDACNVCGGDGSTCKVCELVDCKGTQIPNAKNYCHLDVNKDGTINKFDSLAVINSINSNGSGAVSEGTANLDTSKDGHISPIDVLLIINFMNKPPAGVSLDDECGICGGPGKNSCGSCIGDFGYSEDLGCGCGNSGPSGCDLQCGSTMKDLGCGCGEPGKDLCGVCGGDGLSCQKKECKYFSVTEWVTASGMMSRDQNIIQTEHKNNKDIGTDAWKAKSDFAGLQCVKDLFTKCNVNLAGGDIANAKIRGSNNGVCVQSNANCEIENMQTSYCVLSSFDSSLKGSAKEWKTISALKSRRDFIIDPNCNVVEANPKDMLCGAVELHSAYWRYSPISLELTPDSGQEYTVTNFSLDNTADGQYFTWRGNKKFPLLVYDPSNSGKVSSATQLFGDWTFGGKKFASLDGGISDISTWSNGFEALSQLDINKDGEISGRELNELALWYDDGDGVSEQGEVKKLKTEGVTRLSYTVKGPTQKGLDIRVENGFEMISNGKVKRGALVDWFASKSDSKTNLISMIGQSLASSFNAPKNKDIIKSDSQLSKKLIPDVFVGSWVWKVENEEQSIGLIELFNEKSGPGGVSIAFEPLFDKEGKQSYRVSNAEISEIKSNDSSESGNLTLSFVVESEGSITKTNVTYKSSLDTLEGVSETSFKNVEDKKVAPKVVHKWLASRYLK